MNRLAMSAKGDIHNFVLVLAGATEPDAQLEDGLFEAGCDDATLAFRNGVPYLEFDRQASSLDSAILSALRDVERAGLSLTVVSIDVLDPS